MSAAYLLDTNILSDLIRQPQGIVRDRIFEIGEEVICTSVIVAAELKYGTEKRGSKRLTDRVDVQLRAIDVLPLDCPADERYGKIRAELEWQGKLIGPNNLLIAAQCLSLGLTLVTDNTSEFSRVAGLSLSNWLH